MKITIIPFLIASTIAVTTIISKPQVLEEKEILKNSNKIIDGKIRGYFNNDNLEDYIIKDDNKDSYSIFINNGNKGYIKQISFRITEDDFDSVDDPLNNLFISNPAKGEIIIGATCCGNFKSTESNYYKFFDEVNNWILYKSSTSVIDSDFIPKIELNYFDYSILINGKKSNNISIKEKELIKRKEKNEKYFNSKFKEYKKANENKTIAKISGNLNYDDLAELLYVLPLNKSNINDFNDLAYYIGLCKDGKTSSIFLLKEIIKKEPNRTVAYLNLGDAQWGFDENEKAKKSYMKYISLMKSQGKDLSKIPTRVYERIK